LAIFQQLRAQTSSISSLRLGWQTNRPDSASDTAPSCDLHERILLYNAVIS
jgi:hypothetical protein